MEKVAFFIIYIGKMKRGFKQKGMYNSDTILYLKEVIYKCI